MTEEQYIRRRAAIMDKIYRHEDAFANGRPKYPRCLKADMEELRRLDEEWEREGGEEC